MCGTSLHVQVGDGLKYMTTRSSHNRSIVPCRLEQHCELRPFLGMDGSDLRRTVGPYGCRWCRLCQEKGLHLDHTEQR